jgi:hypothetical protein
MIDIGPPEYEKMSEGKQVKLKDQRAPKTHDKPREFRAGAGHSGQYSHTAPLPLWLGLPSSILVCLRLL